MPNPLYTYILDIYDLWNKSTNLNIPKYYYLSQTIKLYISYLFTQLNDLTVLSQTIQFSISLLFALSLNVKQFDLTHGWDPFRH